MTKPYSPAETMGRSQLFCGSVKSQGEFFKTDHRDPISRKVFYNQASPYDSVQSILFQRPF